MKKRPFILGVILTSLITYVIITIIIVSWSNAGEGEKLFIGITGIFVAIAITVIGIGAILLVGSLVGVFGSSTGTTNGKRPIIFNVPKNNIWVLRNVWKSNPITLEGYQEKKEGWRFYIPFIWHSDEGLVSLVPVQHDAAIYTVNCIDGNDVKIDTRLTYFVREKKEDDQKTATKFLLNTVDTDVDNLIVQRAKVAINRAMDVGSQEALSWTPDMKKTYGNKATEIANTLLCDDGGKDYGIESIINVENISPPPAIKEAMDKKTAAQIEAIAAVSEAKAMKIIKDETGANPTWVMLSQTIGDALRAILGKGGK